MYIIRPSPKFSRIIINLIPFREALARFTSTIVASWKVVCWMIGRVVDQKTVLEWGGNRDGNGVHSRGGPQPLILIVP